MGEIAISPCPLWPGPLGPGGEQGGLAASVKLARQTILFRATRGGPAAGGTARVRRESRRNAEFPQSGFTPLEDVN